MSLPQRLPNLDWLIARPIAHRGLHNEKKGMLENTASAFAAAIASNYAIECDLQLTADHEAVVFHDDMLDRLTPERGKVADRSVAELISIPLRSSPERIPTLAELARLVDGRVPLLIELKSQWNGSPALPFRALEVMRDYRGPFALMSFDPDFVRALRAASPTTPRGIVADRVTNRPWQRLPYYRRLELRHFLHLEQTAPHFVSFDAKGLPWPPVRQLRQVGLPVITWTVRSVRRYCDQITFEGFLP
jgi:glycerophosphoryl diester phosphodiesterase